MAHLEDSRLYDELFRSHNFGGIFRWVGHGWTLPSSVGRRWGDTWGPRQLRCTGIPVRMRIASTKTLVKLANYAARRTVVVADIRDKLLRAVDVSEVGH